MSRDDLKFSIDEQRMKRAKSHVVRVERDRERKQKVYES